MFQADLLQKTTELVPKNFVQLSSLLDIYHLNCEISEHTGFMPSILTGDKTAFKQIIDALIKNILIKTWPDLTLLKEKSMNNNYRHMIIKQSNATFISQNSSSILKYIENISDLETKKVLLKELISFIASNNIRSLKPE